MVKPFDQWTDEEIAQAEAKSRQSMWKMREIEKAERANRAFQAHMGLVEPSLSAEDVQRILQIPEIAGLASDSDAMRVVIDQLSDHSGMSVAEIRRCIAGASPAGIERKPLAPKAIEAAPSSTAAAPTSISDPRRSLSSNEICDAFAGLGLNSVEWQKAIKKNRPAWLRKCSASLGRQGANPVQGRWYPVKIAEALVTGRTRKGCVPATKLDAAFRRNSLLRPFAKDWEDLRADNPAWGQDRD